LRQEGKTDKSEGQHVNVGDLIKIKNKAKNKAKNETKKENQTKNKGKKDWQQR
jgi:ribosomal protein S4